MTILTMATTLFTLPHLQATPAYGDASTNRQTLNASIGLGVMDFDYQEFNEGEQLNHEHGALFGINIGVHKAWEKHFIEADIGYFVNEVDYDGQTQNGTPVNTDTDEIIANGAALYGRYLQVQQKFRHALVAGLGYRHWQRDINSTRTALGVFETYTWWYGQLGWHGVYQASARSSWLAEATLVQPFDAEIDIDFRNAFDDTSLALDEETGFQLKLTYQLRLAKSWQLDVAGFYNAWDIGRSREATLRRNGAAIGKIFEPESETRSAGLMLSGSYAF